MLRVEQARAKILASFAPLPVARVNVADALGLVAAEDLAAPHPLPRFDNSAMDGYAVRRADVEAATDETPVMLELRGEVAAGDAGDAPLEAGTAVRIMTGAPLPPGADAIVPVEQAEEEASKVRVLATPPRHGHVRGAGEDVDLGDVVVRAGTELSAGELAMLASLGLSPVLVHPRPKVAIVTTGRELVEPEESPRPGEIRDSNSVALAALVAEAGAQPVSFGRAADRKEEVVDLLQHAAADSDLVVSSGGASVGRYDFVKDAVAELGEVAFWRVAMQPGKPVVWGRVAGTPFLGLPGNPVSIHVTFEQFVRPAIRKLRGCRYLLRPRLRATLTKEITKKPGRALFARVRLEIEEGGLKATPTGPQASHIQSSLLDCHGVVELQPDATVVAAGAEVAVEVWSLPER